VANSWDSLSYLKEFILIPTRSNPFKTCSLQRISKNYEVFRADWLTSIDLS